MAHWERKEALYLGAKEATMIRALKGTLIVFGVLHILLGLGLIFAPQASANLMGFGTIDTPSIYLAALVGLLFLSASIWLIVASRYPVQNITWVKFAILWTALGVVIQSFLVVQGIVQFSQAGVGIISDAVFAIAFLAFYPYRLTTAKQ